MRRLAPLLAALLLAACDADPPPAPLVDASRLDGGGSADAGADAAARDAGRGDGAMPLDAGEDAGPPRGCIPGAVEDVASGALIELTLSLAGGRAMVAWTEARGGRTDLHARVEGDDGAFGDPLNLTEGLDPPRHPRALSGAAHRLVWTATPGGLDGWDVHSIQVGPAGAPTEVIRLAPDPDDAGDHFPSLVRAGGLEHALWVRRRFAGGGAPVLARWPFEEGASREDVLAEARPTAAVLGAPLEDSLLWVWPDRGGDGTYVHAMIEDPTAGTVGEPLELSTGGSATPHVAVASGGSEAAVVWEERDGDRRELRMRLLNAEGGFESAERPLTIGASSGHTPSLVAYAGGYLGLWHEYGTRAGDRAFLAYIGPNDGVIGGLPLAPVAGEITATALVTDGTQVRAAWLERTGGAAVARTVPLLCNF